MDTLIDAISPLLAEVAVTLFFAALTWAAAVLRRWVAVDLSAKIAAAEAQHREALHRAIDLRIKAAIRFGMGEDSDLPERLEAEVRAAMPDAIAALRPLPGALTDLIRAKLIGADR